MVATSRFIAAMFLVMNTLQAGPVAGQIVGGDGTSGGAFNAGGGGGPGGTAGDGNPAGNGGAGGAATAGSGSGPFPGSGGGVGGGSGGDGFDGGGGGGAQSGGGAGHFGNGLDGGGGGGGGNGVTTGTNYVAIEAITGGAGGAGGQGSFNGSAGGGGGGGNGILLTGGSLLINNGVRVSGGSGGAGGITTEDGNAGGGGGGYGVWETGVAGITNNGIIVGGAGAAASGGTNACGNAGGGGGGVALASGGSISNTGTVRGGAGGPNPACFVGNVGAGGAGITGQSVTVINSGTITGGLSGSGAQANAITFTGGTNLLELQAGSTITGHVVAFSAADTFRLGGTANSSFDVSAIGPSAQYQGFGVFQKTGTSTWTLTGTNTAALPWSINDGTLLVNGTLANSTMTVSNGGTLGGTGTVGAATINSGGIFAPGSGTPGTSMTVSSLALASGAFYLVQINPTTSSFANVTGTATLGGATVNAAFANGSFISKQYTILIAAGGVSGTFASNIANTNLPQNFSDTLSYDATHAFLNLTLGFAGPNFGSGLNVNQQNVAKALTNSFNTNGGIPAVYGTLTPAGLTQASGETATGSQQTTFDAMDLFMGTMLDPSSRGMASTPGGGASFYASEGDAGAYASTQNAGAARDAYGMFTKTPPAVVPFEQRWSVWASGFGGSQTTDGNAAVGSNTSTSSVYGTAVGADYRISPYTIAGFALAGGGTNFSVAGSGFGHSDLFQAGAFVKHTVGAAYISAALAYGWQDITTDRTVTAGGASQLRAEFDANAFSGRLEGGYRFVAPWVGGIGITPYAAAQFTTFDLPAYAEQAIAGSSAFALAYNAKDVTDPRSELGIRADKSWAMTDGILTLRGRVAWAHDYDPDRSIAATFESLPTASFVVNGAAQAADSALVTASIEKKWLSGWSAAATFEGEFSDVTRFYAGKGVVRYQW